MAENTVSTGSTAGNGLTEVQQQAVTHLDGPLLVLAGPGSGKTTVVTHRIAHLVQQGIPPWHILALTFTNKAAGEMRERIETLLPDEQHHQRGLTVCTFHSFCARLLRRYAEFADLSPQYTIYDAADQRDAIKKSLSSVELNSKNWTPASIGGAISNAKNQLLDAEAYAAQAGDFYTRTIAKVYTAYQNLLHQNNALDFDDLLLISAKLLSQQDEVCHELRMRYQYLLVDEYQDTNHTQFIIAHMLAAEHQNICVVGDPDQSIYGWRGADIRNILEFEEHFPKAKVIALGENFRSTSYILQVADEIIQHNQLRKHKELFTNLGEGEKPQMVTCVDEHHEAEMIIDEFRRRHENDSIAWKDMAVLYRINALSRVLENVFRQEGIPYVIARGTAFYERKEIKDALAYLRFLANPQDNLTLNRIINVPTRGIGKTSWNRVEVNAQRNQMSMWQAMLQAGRIDGLSPRAIKALTAFSKMVSHWHSILETSDSKPQEDPVIHAGQFADLVERVIRESGLEGMHQQQKNEEDQQRLANLAELVSAAAEFSYPFQDELAEMNSDTPLAEQSVDNPEKMQANLPPLRMQLQAYLESVALVSDADAIDPSLGAVTLMTLHAAKGLEYEVIAMAGMEEGLLPHMNSMVEDSKMEEERRLCFVGITRAKRSLLLTQAGTRTLRGKREPTIPSRFLRECSADTIMRADFSEDHGGDDYLDTPMTHTSRERQADCDVSAGEFPVGCMVRHPKFGVGRVEGVMRRARGSTARIYFESVGLKTLVLAYAKLTPLS